MPVTREVLDPSNKVAGTQQNTNIASKIEPGQASEHYRKISYIWSRKRQAYFSFGKLCLSESFLERHSISSLELAA